LIKSARNTGNKNRWYKHSREHEGNADDRTRDFLHRFESGVARRHAFLDVTLDCFDNDDRVINHQTNGQHQAKER
jgi:hypothetical protein